MKTKQLRKAMRRYLPGAVRLVWVKLCALPRGERWRLAWMLLRRQTNLDAVFGREEA